MNRCDRCKREIKNPRAKYGPVCAKIMGIDEQYYTDSRSRQSTAFQEGALMAQRNIAANPYVENDKIDEASYAYAMGSYMAALERGDIKGAERELANARKILNGEDAGLIYGANIFKKIAEAWNNFWNKNKDEAEETLQTDISRLEKPKPVFPLDSIPEPQYVTKENLTDLKWYNVDNDMLDDLNRVLQKYEINTPERIRHFLA